MIIGRKNSCFLKSLAILCLVLQVKPAKAASNNIDVVFLTQPGPRVLKSWSPEELTKFAAKKSEVSSQKFLFDDSSSALDLSDRASIDLVTITTDATAGAKVIRVPRFLIWRGFFQFKWDSKTNQLSSHLKNKVEQGRILVPAWYFDLSNIRKIELSDHQLSFPQTKLKLRTNPAASRGEKLFTQNCLACHSVPTYGSPSLSPTALTKEKLEQFSTIHKKWPELKLDSKSIRGLIEYSEALAFEKK